MPSTPSRGYTYPTASSPATVPADLQVPLEQIDADVQTLTDQMEGAVRLEEDGSLPDPVESRVEAIAREYGSPTGSIPIFPTLAEALAWEAANPGRTALTTESQEPDVTPPSSPGVLSVQVSDVYANLTVTGAQDDRGITGYAFRVDAGAWSEWQSEPSFTATGLTRDTDYSFQHRVRDVGENVVEGVAVQARTLSEAPIPYDMAARALNPAFYLPGDGLVNEGWGSASSQQSSNASQDGAALAGWPDARRVTPNGYDRFTTGEPMPSGSGQRPFGASIIVHFADLNAGDALFSANSGALLGQGASGFPLFLAGKQSSSSTAWDIRAGGTYDTAATVAGEFPLDIPHTGTYVVGVDYDGTTATHYVNGAVVDEKQVDYNWSGFRTGVNLSANFEGAVEWRGFILDEAPLGPSVHADLAVAAGVA